NTVTPLLKRMEAEGILLRKRGKDDARQMIVSLTPKGQSLQEELLCVPQEVGVAVLCESVTPETVPGLFLMLDDIIGKLRKKDETTTHFEI
ncbi:MAG: MarR family transcriptional regulator, partial [Bacteroidales bacterium]|nr:MarR family transcriptional regulator [Bacteroidales bacterium]